MQRVEPVTQTLDDDPKPTVLVYVHGVLSPSMTFIRTHVEHLRRFSPIYVGLRRVPGLTLNGVECAVVNETNGVLGRLRELSFRTIGFAPRLIDSLRVHQPKLIHAHFGTSGPDALRIAHSLNIPLIVTFHGRDATVTELEARKSFQGRQLERNKAKVNTQSTRIIAVSHYIKSKLIEKGYTTDNLIVHYNGIDTEYFSPNGVAKKGNVVVGVGRLVEKKGFRYLIEAMQRVSSQVPDAELVLIGDGPLRADLESTANRCQINVKFLGLQDQDAVKSWLERARVVVVPSVTARDGDSEGLPTVLLEAQSMGVPVVATRHSGIPEGMLEEETGFLVDERDAKGLASGIVRVLSDADAWRCMSTSARHLAVQKFCVTSQVAQLEHLYGECIEHGHR